MPTWAQLPVCQHTGTQQQVQVIRSARSFYCCPDIYCERVACITVCNSKQKPVKPWPHEADPWYDEQAKNHKIALYLTALPYGAQEWTMAVAYHFTPCQASSHPSF